jgi:hypothetical protein
MINKTITSLLISSFLLTLVSCRKNVNCDNAKVCVQNNTGEVVYYRWGYSSADFEDSLMPGQTTCDYVGEIHINYTLTGHSSQTTFTGFYSSEYDIFEEITACETNYSLD